MRERHTPLTQLFVGVLILGAIQALLFAARWEDDYAAGRAALAAGKYEAAVVLFERAIQSRPSPGVIRQGMWTVEYFPRYYLATAYLGLNQTGRAHDNFVRALNEGLEQAPGLLGECRKALERLRTELDEAVAKFQASLRGARRTPVLEEDWRRLQAMLPAESSDAARYDARVAPLRERFLALPAMSTGSASLAKGRDYALLIATNEYDDRGWAPLDNPVFDAQTIARELQDQYGFATEIVENPRFKALQDVLARYEARSFAENDQLLIFVAGHGIYDQRLKDGFIAARDSTKDDPFRQTYLSHTVLHNVVNNIRAKHVMLILDTCHGGAFGNVRGAADSAYDSLTEEEQITRIMALTTRKYLTSGGNEYVSDGAPGAHSPFAYRLLEAWRRGGSGSGILSYYSLIDWVRQVATSQPRWGNFGADEPGSDFVFVRNRQPVK